MHDELADNAFIRFLLDDPVYVHIDDESLPDTFLFKFVRCRAEGQGEYLVKIYAAPGQVRRTANGFGIAAIRGRDVLELNRECSASIEFPRGPSIILTAADVDAILQTYQSDWPKSHLNKDTEFSVDSINCLIGVLDAHLIDREEVSAAYLSTGRGPHKIILLEIIVPLSCAPEELAIALQATEWAARDVSWQTPFTVTLIARASNVPSTFLAASRTKIYQRI